LPRYRFNPDSLDHDMTASEHRPAPLLRSGTAARLAGISPSTLRIWEHRYGVVSPPRSAAGQRTYALADVQRLRLIKRLTGAGHAIGTLAHLGLDGLVRLADGNEAATAPAQRVVLVGRTLVDKLDDRLQPPPAAVFDDLDHLERALAEAGTADVLVVHLPSLRGACADRVLAARAQLPARQVLVLYSFAAGVHAEALRAAGVKVRREPVGGKELARWIAASSLMPPPAAMSPSKPTAVVAPGASAARRYSDAELVALMEAPSAVACECPRHLAEIVTLLVGFERYSAECVSASPADAALHRHLQQVAAQARTLFEQSLARVVATDGAVV
jgi:hypothetical protein